jgi:WD40 repeat protein
LIFGYKQTGEDAVRAHNVFYYLTYEGAIDIDAITDPVERKSVEAQIFHFGQTPTQLLRKPHPKRMSRNPSLILTNTNTPHHRLLLDANLRTANVCFLATAENSSPTIRDIIAIDHRGVISIRTLTFQSNGYVMDNMVPTVAEAEAMNFRRIMSPFCYDTKISSRSFACSTDGSMLISCCHWDNMFKFVNTDTGKILNTYGGHDDVVTCLAVSEDGKVLVTGAKCSTIIAWDIVTDASGNAGVMYPPRASFYGHDDQVTCLAVNVEYDIVVSGSQDGTCIVHSLRNSEYIRTVHLPNHEFAVVEIIRISKDGSILVYSKTSVSTAMRHDGCRNVDS